MLGRHFVMDASLILLFSSLVGRLLSKTELDEITTFQGINKVPTH